MSGLVGGMDTSRVSGSPGASSVRNDMRSRRSLTCVADKFSPVQELTYETCACVCRQERSGEITTRPSGYIILTGSTLGGTFQSGKTRSMMTWNAHKGHFTILGEHRRYHVCHNIEFRLVRRRQVNKNISGVESYLAMLRVYDGREGKYTIFPVIDNWVDGGVANNGQVFSQMTIRLCHASANESLVTLESHTS